MEFWRRRHLEGDELDPNHVYENEGLYTVSLTVIDKADKTATVTRKNLILASNALAFDQTSILLMAIVVLSAGAVCSIVVRTPKQAT